MPFAPGQSGNLNGAKEKQVFDATLRLIKQNPEKLKKALESVLDQAAGGSLPHLDWLSTKLEGRPAQSVTVSGDDERPLVSLIRVLVVNANDEPRTITHDNSEQSLTLPAVEEKKGEEIIQETPPPTPTPCGHCGEGGWE